MGPPIPGDKQMNKQAGAQPVGQPLQRSPQPQTLCLNPHLTKHLVLLGQPFALAQVRLLGLPVVHGLGRGPAAHLGCYGLHAPNHSDQIDGKCVTPHIDKTLDYNTNQLDPDDT